MKLTVSDIDLGSLIVSEEQTATRTLGTHVSAIIRHISKSIGATKKNDFTEDDLNAFAIIGRLWERVLADILFREPRYVRPGEIERDGIIGSPDHIDLEEWADVELKVTWVSAKNFTERQKFREYLWQSKSYCYMLSEERPMLKAKIVVLHVCGYWTPPVPCAKEYNLTYTPQELKENWRMLLANLPPQLS